MESNVFYMLLWPLLGSAFLGLSHLAFPGRLNRWAGWIASGAILLAFFNAYELAKAHFFGSAEPLLTSLGDWIVIGDFHLRASFYLDGLSSILAMMVTGVSFLIHVYSIGYMSHDEGRSKYFSYLNLFVMFMLILVTASSLPVLFVGWEGVGLCSYLLIGFWFTDPEKAKAGKKAFLVNRVGDAGVLLAMFLIYTTFGTLEMQEVVRLSSSVPLYYRWVLELIGILLFVGCMGKSAQFPLYVWLPDAMAGPTPVSALIHAATMVTAGVYLLGRMSGLYALAPMASSVIAWVGAFTAVFAATIAIAQQDIKKVLAFSTVSQLGFMVLAMGVGAYWAGIFHLLTHAFFKALLFMAAGSVIHALDGEQDMKHMGGLRIYLIGTTVLFAVGGLALVGFPGFSGYFSKDAILYGAVENHQMGVFVLGFIAALFTAVYTTRLFASVFFGVSRIPKESLPQIHESPPVMLWPMGFLAVLSVFGGLLPLADGLKRFFGVSEVHAHHGLPFSEGQLALVVSVVVLFLIWFTYKLFIDWTNTLDRLERATRGLKDLLSKQYHYDDLVMFLGGAMTVFLAWLARLFDGKVIDRRLDQVAGTIRGMGHVVARWQNGLVQSYALIMILGMVLVALALVWGVK